MPRYNFGNIYSDPFSFYIFRNMCNKSINKDRFLQPKNMQKLTIDLLWSDKPISCYPHLDYVQIQLSHFLWSLNSSKYLFIILPLNTQFGRADKHG